MAETPGPDVAGQAEETRTADGAQVLKFALSECRDFFGHLAKTVEQAMDKGEIPASMFRQKKASNVMAKADKVKRKPSAFNIFVQKKCEQMRAAGAAGQSSVENSAVFGQAAQAWKALSDEQRKAYMLMYAENSEDPALNNLPEAGGKPNPKAEAPTEKATPAQKKRKKDAKEEPEKPSLATVKKEAQEAAAADAEEKKKKKKKKKSVTAAE